MICLFSLVAKVSTKTAESNNTVLNEEYIV